MTKVLKHVGRHVVAGLFSTCPILRPDLEHCHIFIIVCAQQTLSHQWITCNTICAVAQRLNICFKIANPREAFLINREMHKCKCPIDCHHLLSFILKGKQMSLQWNDIDLILSFSVCRTYKPAPELVDIPEKWQRTNIRSDKHHCRDLLSQIILLTLSWSKKKLQLRRPQTHSWCTR